MKFKKYFIQREENFVKGRMNNIKVGKWGYCYSSSFPNGALYLLMSQQYPPCSLFCRKLLSIILDFRTK